MRRRCNGRRGPRPTFPLVPVAVGIYSIAFNIFDTALLLPFIGIFDRVLSRIGRTSDEDEEDFLLRGIRRFTASMLKPDLPPAQANLLASLIEEEDFTATFVKTQHQMLRRYERVEFSEAGRTLVMSIIGRVERRGFDLRPASDAGMGEAIPG